MGIGVGTKVGENVGLVVVGAHVGDGDGFLVVGIGVGLAVNLATGCLVGMALVGAGDGKVVGLPVLGGNVGVKPKEYDGRGDGPEGALVGANVGVREFVAAVGFNVEGEYVGAKGMDEGFAVGRGVG